MAENFSNFAQTNLASALSNTATDLLLVDATDFPEQEFYIVVSPDTPGREIMFISSRDDNVLFIGSRAQQGTALSSHAPGAMVIHGALAHHHKAFTEHLTAEAPHPSKRFILSPAATQFTLNHNLPNKKPDVVVTDSTGRVIITDVEYTSDTQVVITVAAAFSGEAHLK
jgi:hypothetical protein